MMKRLICLLLAIVMYLGISGCAGQSNSGTTPKVYELDGDTIQSFTAIVGTSRFEGMDSTQKLLDNGSTMHSYRYSEVSNVETDVTKYVEYLLENNKFEYRHTLNSDDDNGETIITLTKTNSSIKDMFTVLISYSVDKKTVKITFTKEIPDDTAKLTKIVGSEIHGYLEIPDDWSVFNSIEGTSTLMSWVGDASTIMHLDIMPGDYSAEVYATNSMNTLITQVGEDNVATSFEELDGYKAYYIASKHPNNAVLLVWYLDGSDGKTHYIAAESKLEDWEEVYNIACTFHLKN